MKEKLVIRLSLLKENSDAVGVTVSAICFSLLAYRRDINSISKLDIKLSSLNYLKI